VTTALGPPACGTLSRVASIVPAAGTIPWRHRDGRLEVALVHRPKYDDWSWAKGKLDPGEHPSVAAVRETFEETGLLLGVRTDEPIAATSGPWQAFAEAGILPDLGVMRFIGRAITPPGRPRRFDARFFTADATAIAHRIEGVTGPDAELTELVWMTLAEAKQLDMPAVTGVMMEELDARIADGFGHDLPVPFYSMPRGRFQRQLL
jgi:8-oxo-dGTP pyrophosphatase MutT (NUDIX family)